MLAKSPFRWYNILGNNFIGGKEHENDTQRRQESAACEKEAKKAHTYCVFKENDHHSAFADTVHSYPADVYNA
jgi:hypothetical protein